MRRRPPPLPSPGLPAYQQRGESYAEARARWERFSRDCPPEPSSGPSAASSAGAADGPQAPGGGAVGAYAGGGGLGLVNPVTSGAEAGDPREFKGLNEARRLQRMRRGVLAAAQLLQQEAPRSWAAMVTLTYRPGVRWSPRHISAFCKRARESLGRVSGDRCRYVWVLELTKAGVPHYHVLFWLPPGVVLPKPDRAGWWPHGSSRIERARNAVGYLVKYVSKGAAGLASSYQLPRGARLFGLGGLSAEARHQKAWRLLPRYIRLQVLAEDRVRRAAGGGWVAPATGEWWPAARLIYHQGQVSWAAASPVGASA
jgi:hypothetical protein